MGRIMLAFILGLFLLGMAAPLHAQTPRERVVYLNDAGELVALNPATGESAVWLVYDALLERSFSFHPAPDASALAIVTRRGAGEARLAILETEAGGLLFETSLYPPNFSPPSAGAGDPRYEMMSAVGEVAWSPDSSRLAFISGAAGSADVHLFNRALRQSEAPISLPQTATRLSWSSDSARLLFSEIFSFGAGTSLTLEGVYLAEVNTGGLTRLALPPNVQQNGLYPIGWRDATTLYYSALNFQAFGASGIYRLDASTGQSQELLPPLVPIAPPILDASTGGLAFIVPQTLSGGLALGAYTWAVGTDKPFFVKSGEFYSVSVARAGFFLFEESTAAYLVPSDQAEPLPQPLPAGIYGVFVSPNPEVDALALARPEGLFMSRVSSDDSALVWESEVQVPLWSGDGTTFYTYGFAAEGAGLVAVNVQQRTVRLLDSRMAVNSPRAVLTSRP